MPKRGVDQAPIQRSKGGAVEGGAQGVRILPVERADTAAGDASGEHVGEALDSIAKTSYCCTRVTMDERACSAAKCDRRVNECQRTVTMHRLNGMAAHRSSVQSPPHPNPPQPNHRDPAPGVYVKMESAAVKSWARSLPPCQATWLRTSSLTVHNASACFPLADFSATLQPEVALATNACRLKPAAGAAFAGGGARSTVAKYQMERRATRASASKATSQEQLRGLISEPAGVHESKRRVADITRRRDVAAHQGRRWRQMRRESFRSEEGGEGRSRGGGRQISACFE